MTSCKYCLLPSTVPGTALDQNGVCSLCQEYTRIDKSIAESNRKKREDNLEQALKDCRGKGPYDALVCFSGGKDSVYLLYKLKIEYKLNVLAFVTDMNVPEVAWENINKTIEALDVDLVIYRPPKEFYQKFFKYLLKNQNEGGAVRTVCYVCAPLFEGYALQVAVEKKIPLILAGYAPGQPEPDRMFYEYDPKHISEVDWTPPEFRNNDILTGAEKARFWNPKTYPPGTPFPRYLAPFHAWEYSQEEVMKKVVELGLIKNTTHASPVHSNCPINWLLMYSDLEKLGYNPYNPEFSRLIREGKANHWYWKMALPLVNFMIRHKIFLGKNVKSSLEWLGFDTQDLHIVPGKKPTTWDDLKT